MTRRMGIIRRAAMDIRRRLRRGGGDAGFESRLVWLVGSPRSGSTWLLKLLGEHPLVATINEPLIGDHLGPFMADQPGIEAADLSVDNFTLSRLRQGSNAYFFSDSYRHVWLPLLGDLIRERLRAQVASHPVPDPVLVIKEPHGSQAIDMILEALPRARLLFLLRDGRDVVDSEVAAFAEGSWLGEAFGVVSGIPPSERLKLVEDAAHKWLWRTEVVEQAFERHRGPKHLVRYEDLRADPVQHLAAMSDWLGLPTAAEGVSRSVDRHSFERIPEDQRGPQKIFRSASPGAWRENLSEVEQASVESIMGSKLRSLGYK